MFSRCVVTVLLVTTTGLFPPALFAQPDSRAEVKGMGNKDAGKAPTGVAHAASGVVKTIDASSANVLIQHGPVKSLNWPARLLAPTLEHAQ